MDKQCYSEKPNNLFDANKLKVNASVIIEQISKEEAVQVFKDTIKRKSFCTLEFKNMFLNECNADKLKLIYLPIGEAFYKIESIEYRETEYSSTHSDSYYANIDGEKVRLDYSSGNDYSTTYSGTRDSGQTVSFKLKSGDDSSSYNVYTEDGQKGTVDKITSESSYSYYVYKKVPDWQLAMMDLTDRQLEMEDKIKKFIDLDNFDVNLPVKNVDQIEYWCKGNVNRFASSAESSARAVLKKRGRKAQVADKVFVNFSKEDSYTKTHFYPIYAFNLNGFISYIDAITGKIIDICCEHTEEYFKLKRKSLISSVKLSAGYIMGIILFIFIAVYCELSTASITNSKLALSIPIIAHCIMFLFHIGGLFATCNSTEEFVLYTRLHIEIDDEEEVKQICKGSILQGFAISFVIVLIESAITFAWMGFCCLDTKINVFKVLFI